MTLTGAYARTLEEELHRRSERLRLVRQVTAASRRRRRSALRRFGSGLRAWFDEGQLGPGPGRVDTDRY
jgi:hypothetical protein